MIKGTNKYEKLEQSLEGYETIETLSKKLMIDRAKAIYVIHRLRKLGFVKTSYGVGKKRVYYISLKNKQKGISYTEIINKFAPVGLVSSEPYYIHGRIPSYEETLIYAIKKKDIRYLIASLALFRKITNWSLLYRLAKKEDLVNEVVALYEVSRKVVKKVKRMPKRFINLAKKRKTKKSRYIIEHFSSDDFKDIEQKWKIYIPLNLADLEEYKR
ncbi:MAG: hypothetical protein AABX03_05355 [Nanoarchaeota archaeon]